MHKRGAMAGLLTFAVVVSGVLTSSPGLASTVPGGSLTPTDPVFRLAADGTPISTTDGPGEGRPTWFEPAPGGDHVVLRTSDLSEGTGTSLYVADVQSSTNTVIEHDGSVIYGTPTVNANAVAWTYLHWDEPNADGVRIYDFESAQRTELRPLDFVEEDLGVASHGGLVTSSVNGNFIVGSVYATAHDGLYYMFDRSSSRTTILPRSILTEEGVPETVEPLQVTDAGVVIGAYEPSVSIRRLVAFDAVAAEWVESDLVTSSLWTHGFGVSRGGTAVVVRAFGNTPELRTYRLTTAGLVDLESERRFVSEDPENANVAGAAVSDDGARVIAGFGHGVLYGSASNGSDGVLSQMQRPGVPDPNALPIDDVLREWVGARSLVDTVLYADGDWVWRVGSPSGVDSHDPLVDADGDGIPDEWERHGVTIDGVFIDLPAMGADPGRKDVFIKLDWMATALPSDLADFLGRSARPYLTTKPSEEVLRLVEDAFADAPVANPDGSTGINVHFTLTDDPIPYELAFSERSGDSLAYWPEIAALSQERMTLAERAVFRYGLMVAAFNRDEAGQLTGHTGVATTPGQVFAVAVRPGGQAQDERGLAGTIMHELGHNLGLSHGGPLHEIDADLSCKPGHRSVMNYLFQRQGMDVDYSRIEGDSVYEPSSIGEEAVCALGGASFDAERHGDLVHHHDDWAGLTFSSGLIGQLSGGVDVPGAVVSEPHLHEFEAAGLDGDSGSGTVEILAPTLVIADEQDPRVLIQVRNTGPDSANYVATLTVENVSTETSVRLESREARILSIPIALSDTSARVIPISADLHSSTDDPNPIAQWRTHLGVFQLAEAEVSGVLALLEQENEYHHPEAVAHVATIIGALGNVSEEEPLSPGAPGENGNEDSVDPDQSGERDQGGKDDRQGTDSSGPTPSEADASHADRQHGPLAITGAEVAGLALIGALLTMAGALLTARRFRAAQGRTR